MCGTYDGNMALLLCNIPTFYSHRYLIIITIIVFISVPPPLTVVLLCSAGLAYFTEEEKFKCIKTPTNLRVCDGAHFKIMNTNAPRPKEVIMTISGYFYGQTI